MRAILPFPQAGGLGRAPRESRKDQRHAAAEIEANLMWLPYFRCEVTTFRPSGNNSTPTAGTAVACSGATHLAAEQEANRVDPFCVELAGAPFAHVRRSLA
jgi:hypothetical protein